MSEKLLSVRELAEWLGLPVGWIYKQTSARPPTIPVIKLGKYCKFRKSEIEAYLDRQHSQGGGGEQI